MRISSGKEIAKDYKKFFANMPKEGNQLNEYGKSV